MQDSDRALEILKSNERTYSELEFLSVYLLCLEDYRNYAKNLSQILIMQLIRILTVIQINKKSFLFRKGDAPSQWFIVFDGELELFHTVRNEDKLIGRVSKGKQVGEREILRGKNYGYACVPSRNTLVLCLNRENFILLLGEQIENRLVELRNFVHNYIPNTKPYSWNFKEKIGYNFSLTEYKRGEIIIDKNTLDDKLYFVYQGEVAVASDEENKSKNLVKLGTGSSFAEENTLLNKPSLYQIRVSSERAIIAYIKKPEIFNLPDETLAKMKKNLQEKICSRSSLSIANEKKKKLFRDNDGPAFKSANKQAREKLMSYILRNRPCTPKRMLGISLVKNKGFKDYLVQMRDCSPSRLRYQTPSLWKKTGLTQRALGRLNEFSF